MPSTSKKQQAFMGAELGRLRSGKKTQTGMSETQLAEFAGSRVSKKQSEKDGRSIIDVETIERKPETGTLKLSGYLSRPGEECHEAQRSHEFLSSWESREIKDFSDYKCEVDFYGPDTDFRTEEINPHHYGRDYEPAPLKDLFKTEEKAEEVGIRMREEYEYSDIATPGTVADSGLESSMAYGSISYERIPTDLPDNRSFKSQQKFRRSQDEVDEDAVKVKKLKKL